MLGQVAAEQRAVRVSVEEQVEPVRHVRLRLHAEPSGNHQEEDERRNRRRRGRGVRGGRVRRLRGES